MAIYTLDYINESRYDDDRESNEKLLAQYRKELADAEAHRGMTAGCSASYCKSVANSLRDHISSLEKNLKDMKESSEERLMNDELLDQLAETCDYIQESILGKLSKKKQIR